MSLAHQTSQQSAQLIDGKYALLRELGSGAAGTVYEAEHLIVGKRVAVKILNPDWARDRTIVARFVAEARAAARIAHANVVDIHDLGVTKDGLSYMVMELLTGETLSEIIETRGALAPEYACELMMQVLAGLMAAHAKGIVHRDLKPANVFVTHPRPDRPLVKVLDFGIAKGVGINIREESLIGTPMYMSPEQAMGQEVDVRTDVYSSAAILYELLAGQPLYDGASVTEILTQVVQGSFRPLRSVNPRVPAELAALVESGLSRHPADRPQSADQFAERVLRFVSKDKSRSLVPISFRSLSAIPLVSADAKNDLGAVEPFALMSRPSNNGGNFPPVELVHIDRWSGERVMTDSLLERPRIPKAPSPPRLYRRDGAAATRSELMERRMTTTRSGLAARSSRMKSALVATLIGFGIGLVVALLLKAI